MVSEPLAYAGPPVVTRRRYPVERVHLDRHGCTTRGPLGRGVYFGVGAPVYMVEDLARPNYYTTVRAPDAKTAREIAARQAYGWRGW